MHCGFVEGTGIRWNIAVVTSCLCSEQFGSTTATGFDNEPLKHISNIVITIMFLLVAFGVPRSRRWRLYCS